MRRHRRTAYHGWAYWITWAVTAAALLTLTVAAFLGDTLVSTLAFAGLAVLYIGVGIPTIADVMGRLAERSGSPREEARSLHEANVELVRDLDEKKRERGAATDELRMAYARIDALRFELDRSAMDRMAAVEQMRHWRDKAQGVTRVPVPPPPIGPDTDATVLLAALREPDPNAETTVLPVQAREVSR